MPKRPEDVIKEEQKQKYSELAQILSDAYAYVKKPEEADELKSFTEALNTLSESKEGEEQKVEEALKTLEGLQTFLEKKPKGSKKSNFLLLDDRAGKHKIRDGLEFINSSLDLGMDVYGMSRGTVKKSQNEEQPVLDEEALGKTAFGRYQIKSKNNTLFTKEEYYKIQRIAMKMNDLAETPQISHFTIIADQIKMTADALYLLSSRSTEFNDAKVWDKWTKNITNLSEMLLDRNRRDYLTSVAGAIDAMEDSPFGENAKDFFDVLELVGEKTEKQTKLTSARKFYEGIVKGFEDKKKQEQQKVELDRKANELYDKIFDEHDEGKLIYFLPENIENSVNKAITNLHEESAIRQNETFDQNIKAIKSALEQIPLEDRMQLHRDIIDEIGEFYGEPKVDYGDIKPMPGKDFKDKYFPKMVVEEADIEIPLNNDGEQKEEEKEEVKNSKADIFEENGEDELDEGNLLIQKMNAARFIERLRDNAFPIANPDRLDADQKRQYLNNFLKIIAVRQLAGSDRGHVDKLKKFNFSEKELWDRVNEMKKDPVFRGFLENITGDTLQFKRAITAAQTNPGHGGKLDDMLKDYILNLPPGQMLNTKLHERFLPTAKDRIESIKKQIEKMYDTEKKISSLEEDLDKIQNKGGSVKKINELKEKKAKLQEFVESIRPKNAVAEIIELRNMVKADYGKKGSLEKKIPAFEEDTLSHKIDAVRMNREFVAICDRNDVKELLFKGHGGDLTDLVRNLEKDFENHNPDLQKMLKENTIAGRMEQIEKEAGETANKLREEMENHPEAIKNNKDPKADLLRKGLCLMEEYLFLTTRVWNARTNSADPSKLEMSTPWEELNEIEKNAAGNKFKNDFTKSVGGFSQADIADCLEKLSRCNGQPERFRNAVMEKQAEIKNGGAKKNVFDDEPLGEYGEKNEAANKNGIHM